MMILDLSILTRDTPKITTGARVAEETRYARARWARVQRNAGPASLLFRSASLGDRRNVLVQTEHIRRVVALLDRDELRVSLRRIGRPHLVVTGFAGEVHVHRVGSVCRQRGARTPRPRRVVVEAHTVHRPGDDIEEIRRRALRERRR